MGTPHLGAEVAAWGTMMSNIVGALPGGPSTYSGVLRGLELDSETLYTITRRFNEILNQPIPDGDKIQICSVQEGLGMSSIKGAGSKVVPDYSSKFNRTDIEQSFFNQTANHMTMCKFASADDQTYKNTLRTLRGYFRTIRERQAEIQQAQELNNQDIALDFAKKLDFAGRLARERQLNSLVTHEDSFDWIWESSFVNWLTCDAPLFWIAGKPDSGKSTLVNHIAKHWNTRKLMEEAFGEGPLIAKFFFDFRGKDGIENNFEGMRRSLLYQLLTKSSVLAAGVKKHFSVTHLDDLIMLADASVLEYVLQKNEQPLLFFIDGLDEYQGREPELLNLINSVAKFNVKVCLSSRYEKPFTVAYKDLEFQFRMDILNRPGIYAYSQSTFADLYLSQPEEQYALQRAAQTIAEMSAGVFLWARFAVFEVIDRVCDGHKMEYAWIQSIVASMPSDLEEVYALIFQSMNEEYKEACGIILQLIDSAQRDLEISELFEAAMLAGIGFRPLEKSVTSRDLDGFERYIGVIGAGLVECFPKKPHEAKSHVKLLRTEVIAVRVIHKSVQTYLMRKGWKELLGKQRALECQHKLWLKICTDFLAGKRVVWDHTGENDLDGIAESSSQPHARSNDSCRGLYCYVYGFLLQHAYNFEQEELESSWPLLQESLDDEFIQEHTEYCQPGHSWSFLGMCNLVAHSYGPSVTLCNDVHLAVSHCLALYFEDALAHCPAAFELDSVVDISVSLPFRSATPSRYAQQTCTTEPTTRLLDSALAIAVSCLCLNDDFEKRWERSELMLSLVTYSSGLQDTIMLLAIRELRKTEIDVLLTLFPERPLRFKSRYLSNEFHHLPRIELADEYSFGPLWEIGGRIEYRPDPEETTKVLRLFLAKGENINSQCGPLGTVLHSVIINQANHADLEPVVCMFRMLIAHGADINAAGPEGNILEYLWRQAHGKTENGHYGPSHFGPLTKFLISMGATNSVNDPNGLIPSRARMWAVAETNGPSSEDIRYHMQGACSDTIDERYCVRDVCRSSSSWRVWQTPASYNFESEWDIRRLDRDLIARYQLPFDDLE